MSSESPLISVVIPAYMAENTLARALDSVVMQRFDDVEVVVVDDCSSDRTYEIARSYAGRIKMNVISLARNSGAAAAFNHAVSAVRGRYICRLDADDTLASHLFDKIAPILQTDSPDIVRGGYNRLRDSVCTYIPVVRSMDLNDFSINVDHFSLWGKFIRTELLTDADNRTFEGIDCWDDLGVLSRIFARRPSVIDVDRPFYTYYISSGKQSLSTSRRERLLADHLAMADRLSDWFDNHGLSERYGDFLDHLKFAAKVKLLRGRGRDVARWKNTYSEVNRRVLSLRHVAMVHRLLFATVAILPTGLSQTISDLCDRLPRLKR